MKHAIIHYRDGRTVEWFIEHVSMISPPGLRAGPLLRSDGRVEVLPLAFLLPELFADRDHVTVDVEIPESVFVLTGDSGELTRVSGLEVEHIDVTWRPGKTLSIAIGDGSI